MASFDRSAVRFAFRETHKGYFTTALRDDGKYGLDDADKLLAAMAKVPKELLNPYQLWLDWEDAPRHDKPVEFSTVLKYAAAKGTSAELVLVRKGFPQVKIKLTRGEGSNKRSSSKLREL